MGSSGNQTFFGSLENDQTKFGDKNSWENHLLIDGFQQTNSSQKLEVFHDPFLQDTTGTPWFASQ